MPPKRKASDCINPALAFVTQKVRHDGESMSSRLEGLATDFQDAASKIQEKTAEMTMYMLGFAQDISSLAGIMGNKLSTAAKTCIDEGSENATRMISLAKEFEDKFKKEREKEDNIRKKVKRCHITDPVKLNVGGTLYQTSMTTLRSCKDSMLEAMFSGNFSMETNELGEYFIDRDGEYFRPILNWLRTGEFVLPPGPVEKERIVIEADYFGLDPLMKLILPPDPPLSEILTDEDLEWIKEQLPGKRFELLYRSTRDGDNPKAFHEKCDNKGPTLITVKTETPWLTRFAAYSALSWQSTETKTTLSAETLQFRLDTERICVPAGRVIQWKVTGPRFENVFKLHHHKGKHAMSGWFVGLNCGALFDVELWEVFKVVDE